MEEIIIIIITKQYHLASFVMDIKKICTHIMFGNSMHLQCFFLLQFANMRKFFIQKTLR